MAIPRFVLRSLAKSMSPKISYPACERNKSHILQVLQKHLVPGTPGNVLEISSGTGQHIAYFANHFPNITFQPSEYETSLFESISAYANEVPTANVKPPVKIDITTSFETWNLGLKHYDYLLNVNMMHISTYNCTVGLFKNAAKVLKQEGLLITYGPYAVDGKITPESNVNFDKGLRMQNSEWGLRDIKDLEKLAESNNIKLVHAYDLPANNKCIIWQKVP